MYEIIYSNQVIEKDILKLSEPIKEKIKIQLKPNY